MKKIEKIKAAATEFDEIKVVDLVDEAHNQIDKIGVRGKDAMTIYNNIISVIAGEKGPDNHVFSAGDVVAIMLIGIGSHYMEYCCNKRNISFEEFKVFSMMNGIVPDDLLKDMIEAAQGVVDSAVVEKMTDDVSKNES